MRVHLINTLVAGLCLGVLAGPAKADDRVCEAQGLTCADLVYRGFTYPYPRPDSSYLYINNGVYPYVVVTDNLLGDSTVRLPDNTVVTARDLLTTLGLEAKIEEKHTPVIGYGSNPAPTQLTQKFFARDQNRDVVIPVMKGTLRDFDVVWTPAFVYYGAMPATITPSAGTDVEVWVTWLDSDAVQVVDGTEFSDHTERPFYVQTTIAGADYDFDGPDPPSMQVYVSCFGALTIDGKTHAVSAIAATGRRFSPISAPEAMEAVIPLLGWKGSVLDLIHGNVVSPQARAKRSTALIAYGPYPDIPGASGLEVCKDSRSGVEDPY